MSDFAYPLHEECGVFGIYDRAGTEDVAAAAYSALYALQHRGQESCGIAVNADGVINAQDALNIRTACAASTVPETQLLLTMDVDLNGRVDAQDVRALADSFVQNTALPTAQEDGQ